MAMEFEEAAKLWKDIQHFDPLAVAEELTGEPLSMHGVGALGFILMHQHANAKREALQAMGDINSHSSYAEAQEILIKFGFTEVYSETFVDTTYRDEKPSTDHYKMFWNPMGILVTLESYWNGKSVNTCHAYFNWKSNSKKKPFSRPEMMCGNGIIMKDGNYRVDLKPENFIGWECNKDGREGLISFLIEMNSKGTFFPKWAKAPHLWFTNYSEQKGHSNYTGPENDLSSDYYGQVRDRKFRMLPKEVQDAIGDPSGDTIRNL